MLHLLSPLKRSLSLMHTLSLKCILPLKCTLRASPLFVFLCSLFTSVAITTSCASDDAPYPSILLDLVDLKTDDRGYLKEFTLDDGKTYAITNTSDGYAKKATYRALCGYVPEQTTATIYQLSGAYFLRDSSAIARRDPVTLRSIWRTPRYINLHLAPKTQGSHRQYFGFVTDSVVPTTLSDGTKTTHTYLSLHHNQNGDPVSYTDDVFASIPLDSIEGLDPASPVTITVNTFDGPKTIQTGILND